MKNLNAILTLATTEIIWLNTPDHAVLNNYVELAKVYQESHISNFVNAILRKIVSNKEKIKMSLPNVKVNLPEWMYNDWLKYYQPMTISSILANSMLQPSLDIICLDKITKKQKDNLISFSNGLEIYPNVIRSNFKGQIKLLPYAPIVH